MNTLLPPTPQESTMLARLAALSSMTFATAEQAIDAYLNFVMYSTETRTAFLALLDPEHLHIVAVKDQSGCPIPENGVLPIQDTFCQYARASGQYVVVTDAAQDPRVSDVASRLMYNIGSYLGVPLVGATGTIQGTLCALDPDPHFFSTTHLHVMQIIARQLAAFTDPDQKPVQVAEAERSTASDDMQAILRMVAHDLRNPLTTIYGTVDLLLSEAYHPLAAEQQLLLSKILEASQYIHRLSMDLIDSTAVELGALSILRYQFDPLQLVQSLIETYMPQAQAQQLTLQAVYASTLPLMWGDADRLRQIISNLLDNAVRYTQTGSIVLNVAVAEPMITFRVEDSGPGIPPALQQTIWQRHVRANTRGKGIGLGLYIVQQLTKAMGGQVGLASTPGKGSCFWICLPLKGPAPHKQRLVQDD